MKAKTVSLLGLDRLTGSMARALKRPGVNLRVVGYAAEQAVSRQAREMGLVDEGHWNPVSAVLEADILVLALPLAERKEILPLLVEQTPAHALLLDMGLLKMPAQTWASQFLHRGHHVGVYPALAAAYLEDGRRGLEAAEEDLFRNSVWSLLAGPDVDPKAVETAVNFGFLLGARPFFLEAAEFDALQQLSRTMPALIASAVFDVLTSSPGWRDARRFAGVDVALTTAPLNDEADLAHLILHDPQAALRQIQQLTTALDGLAGRIQDSDPETLAAYFMSQAEERRRWLRDRAENEWLEAEQAPVDYLSMSERLMGRRRRDRDE